MKDCSIPAESDLRWKQTFAEEISRIAEKMSDYEMERQVSSCQHDTGAHDCCEAVLIFFQHSCPHWNKNLVRFFTGNARSLLH